MTVSFVVISLLQANFLGGTICLQYITITGRVIVAIGQLKKQVDTMHKILNKIYVTTCNPVEQHGNEADIPTMPIEDLAALEKLEKYLADEGNMQSMVNFNFLIYLFICCSSILN